MSEFNYIAMDNKGARKSGTVDARSRDTAVGLLKEQGYYVLSLDEKKSNLMESFMEVRGVPFGEVVSFTRQFSTMIGAGLAISKALNVLADQTTNQKFKRILSDVLRDVEGGASLATAFGRFPDIFSTTYQSLVAAGEASGRLDEILKRLADTMEAERALRAKFKGAMIYPAIVMIAMVGVFIILMVFVVPKLAALYESMNVDLPVVTKGMIALSAFMTNNLILVLLGMVGFVVGVRYYLHTPGGKTVKSRLSLTLPVFGKINKKKELTEFTRTLGLLVNSAVPIVDALNIVSTVVSSEEYRDGARQAAVAIEKGGTLSNYLKQNESFPPILGNMVATGEETGKLDEILERLADFFDEETQHAVEGLSAALEPIILIMLGAMVGFLIISIITPIYKITASI